MRGDAADHLPMCRLPVGVSFPRNAKRAALQHVAEINELEHGFDARIQAGMQKSRCCGAKASGCTHAGCHRVESRARAFQRARVMGHARLEFIEHSGRAALLRAENPCGALCAEERIVHVTHHGEAGVGEPWIHVGAIDDVNVCQVRPDSVELTAMCIQEPNAERAHATHAAIVGGGTPDRQRYVAHPLAKRVEYELSGAEGAGVHRVAVCRWDKGQARCSRHFDDCPVMAEQAVRGGDRLAERSVDRRSAEGAACGRSYRGNRPLAAVGDFHHVDARIGKML